MPSGITKRVKNRKKAVLELLADGCKSTAYVQQQLGTTYEMAYYVLKTLTRDGVKYWKLGKVTVWCLSDDDYSNLINMLLREIRRIVESHNLRFVYPIRLYRLVLKDHKALKLIAKLTTVNYRNAAVLSLLNHLLKQLYGKPYVKGKKTVYYVINGNIAQPQPKA
jgi:hypothetical protein